MKSNRTILQFNNLSLTYGDKVLFNNLSSSIKLSDRIGLVGKNGTGKSSLLKSLSDKIKFDNGSVEKLNNTVEYVPQIDLEQYQSKQMLYEFVQSEFPNWWEVTSLYHEYFGKELEVNQPLNKFSGGEIVRLNICMALAKQPDLLLLDEPTNHLDIKALAELEKLLNKISIPYIVVSHNVDFLNSVSNTIWLLENEELEIYGGNYDFYLEKRNEKIRAQELLFESEKKKKEKLIKSTQRDQLRSNRNLVNGAKLHNPGEDKFFKGFFGNRSQKKAGKGKLHFEKKIEEVETKLEKLKKSKTKDIYIDFKYEPKKGLILSIQDNQVKINDKELITIEDFNIYHSDTIAILGENGSGKTTLINNLSYRYSPNLSSIPRYGEEYNTFYVNQKYELVDPELDLIENLQKSNSSLSEEDIRRTLSNFGFKALSDISKKGHNLSGGELSRLSFAMATSSDIDLMILDEPTNNLDIQTRETIIRHVSKYKGTLIVISHDLDFLSKIGIKKYLLIHNNRLKLLEDREVSSKVINNKLLEIY